MSIGEKLTTIAENEQTISEGINTEADLISEIQSMVDNLPPAGGDGGSYDQGYTAGQQAEYDRFWDAFQDNGNRTDYEKTFFHSFWNDTTYNPKYPIVASVTASQMFDSARITDTKVPIEIRDGVADTAFARCSRLKTIRLLKLSNITRFTNTFTGCTKLENITIEGSIDVNFNISATAVLTNESVQSIIDHLKDLTGATTQTLTFHADVGAKLTDEQKASITAKNWTLAY